MALLRSEAAVRGAPAALLRYETHREDVRERLGTDPGPALQELHTELLVRDRPPAGRQGRLGDRGGVGLVDDERVVVVRRPDLPERDRLS